LAIRANFVQEGSCYTSDLERLGVARSALRFCQMRMERAPVVKNINTLLQLSKKRDHFRSMGLHDKADSLNSKIYKSVDAYVDDVTILAAYENYLKAKLLIAGFVIHQIDPIDNELKIIATEQKKAPVKINRIPQPEKRQRTGTKLPEEIFTALKKQTLNISTIVGSMRYRDILNLSDDVVKMLRDIITERNKVHYWVVHLTDVSTSRFEMIKALADYLNQQVMDLLSTTEEEFKKIRSSG
jgi:hypothetical protein